MGKSGRDPQVKNEGDTRAGRFTDSWTFAVLAGLAGGAVAAQVAIRASKELSVAAFAAFIAVMVVVRGSRQRSVAILCFVATAAALALLLGK